MFLFREDITFAADKKNLKHMKPKTTTLTSLMTTLAIVIGLSSCKKEQVNHDKRNDFTVNQVLTDTLMVRSVVENINYLHQKAGFNIDSITNAI